MTLGRQARRARGLVVAGCLGFFFWTAQTLAAEPGQVAAAPSKSGAPGAGWLRTPPAKSTSAAAAPSSSAGRMALICALVAALAGAALLVKKKRRVVTQRTQSELSVVTAARVGNKANVVVVDVGGRRLLLGVTEAQVTRLCWLDGGADPDQQAQDESSLAPRARSVATTLEPRSPAPAGFQASEDRATARGFGQVLRQVLGRAAPVEDAAVTIARATEDVVRPSAPARIAAPAGAPQMVDIEGQARGLVLRLQKRA